MQQYKITTWNAPKSSKVHNETVCAKNEVGGPALTWVHNLFVVWALDFLLWVVPNTET